jgi:hypothetical protein
MGTSVLKPRTPISSAMVAGVDRRRVSDGESEERNKADSIGSQVGRSGFKLKSWCPSVVSCAPDIVHATLSMPWM